MRLLENNAIDQTYYDGARLNNFIAKGLSGKLYGLNLTHTSQAVYVSPGLLIVKGYRIDFDNEEIYNIEMNITTSEKTNLILRITASSDNASAEITAGQLINFDEIEKLPGTYDYLVAEIETNSAGIINVINKISDISGVGGYQGGTVCELDATQKNISCVLVNNKDVTYSAQNITKATLVLSSVSHGFNSGVNIKSSQVPPQIVFANNSIYPLKLFQFGIETSSYSPSPNCTISMAVFCDGMSIYCYIKEV